MHFNPRAPHGARQGIILTPILLDLFQSTRPAWGATSRIQPSERVGAISIHAPRMGRDLIQLRINLFKLDFNPRAPHGARQNQRLSHYGSDQFQSTRPAWGATHGRQNKQRRADFNPRAPHGARPVVSLTPCRPLKDFNPRAPHGARPHDL